MNGVSYYETLSRSTPTAGGHYNSIMPSAIFVTKAWPAKLPDHTPFDYFLWKYEGQVYRQTSQAKELSQRTIQSADRMKIRYSERH